MEQNNQNMNNEVANNQEQQNTTPVVQVVEPEKKKGGIKGILKKVGIGLGVAAVATVSAIGGFEVGKNQSSKSSTQTPANTGNSAQ